jgi:hypothetical protein
MSRFGSFKIQGHTYDMDDLTLNEVEEIEERAGGTAFSELNFGSAKVMKAIAFVLMKRSNPDLTEDEVGALTRRCPRPAPQAKARRKRKARTVPSSPMLEPRAQSYLSLADALEHRGADSARVD